MKRGKVKVKAVLDDIARAEAWAKLHDESRTHIWGQAHIPNMDEQLPGRQTDDHGLRGAPAVDSAINQRLRRR